LLLQISSVQRARIVPVCFAAALLGATVALVLGAGTSRAAVASRTAVSSTLHGFVHQNDAIGLTFDDGSAVGSQARDVPTIPPGTYTIRVIDDADIHNFHLSGPGVDMTTGVEGTASPTWTVTFQAGGSYTFWCDIHPDFMTGSFIASGAGSSSGASSSSGVSPSAGSSSGSTSSPGASQTSPLRGTLTGTVDARGALKLVRQGTAVSRLRSGRYKITVVDKTPARSFVVRQQGRPPITLTGVAFVGTHTATVDLSAGKWTYSTTGGTKSTGSFTVVV
jgi:plastocyanin